MEHWQAKAEWLAQPSPTTRKMMLNDYNAGHPVLGQDVGGVAMPHLFDNLTHRPSY